MKREWTFTVWAIHPYVRTTQRAKWVDPRYKKYQAWKRDCRLCATGGGVPMKLRSDKVYSVHVGIYCKGKRRGDIDNYLKAALDALWKDDKRVNEVSAKAFEEWDQDRMVVTVREER